MKQMHPHHIRVFSREAARAVDRAAAERFHIPGIVLMENAAINAAAIARSMLPAPGSSVAIVCGGGNNGGDGYAMARHLHNAGIDVRIIAVGTPDGRSDAGINRRICEAMSLTIQDYDEAPGFDADLVVDAILGTGADRPVEGVMRDVIERINRKAAGVLSVDLPSGLDCDRGVPLGIAVEAAVTISFLGWKKGFLNPDSRRYTGDIRVAMIGAPRELLDEFGEPLPAAARSRRITS